MSEFGSINLDRGVFGHPAFRTAEYPELLAWIWLIAAAVKRPRDLRRNNTKVHLERGQLCYSHRYIAEGWGWTVARVQRFLSRLVAESMIRVAQTESAPGQQVTIITICNYEKFQGAPPGIPCGNESPPSQISGTLTSDSRDLVVDAGVARARESYSDIKISQKALSLADEVMVTLGIDLKFVPPGWCGLAHWLDSGLHSGWQPELVRIACARLRARRSFRIPETYRYLAKPVQREHELAAEPHLPIPPVTISNAQGSSHAGKAHVPTSWQGSRDAFREARAELKAGLDNAAAEDGDRSGGQVVRFAAAAGHRQP